jgi:hypothetical protein
LLQRASLSDGVPRNPGGLAVAILAIVISLFAVPAKGEENPFTPFAGSWSGTGTIQLSSGARERLKCRASFHVSGRAMRLAVRCASDSYKFDLHSDLTYRAGRISGSFTETTRGISGSISGTASGGHITAVAEVASFPLNLSIQARGNRASISIQSSVGGAAITFTRS